jgi:ABC-type microcin C transport system duplicated ATPase subunit YejF
MATGASVLILDEPTSSLDAHVRLQTIRLLNDLRARRNLSYLVISHDFRAVARLCTQVVVMHDGQIVDSGSVSDLLTDPRHPYTQQLVRASTFEAPERQRTD